MPFLKDIIFFVIIIKIISLPKCQNDSIKVIITECSSELKRNIYIHNPEQCDIFKEKIPPSQKNLDCHSCEGGKYLNFNIQNNKFECLNCPINTYSTGGNFRIDGKYNEWTEESIIDFKNECFVIIGNNENHYCNSFYSNDNENLKTGNAFSNEKYDYTYVAQLSKNFYLIKEGELKFKYKKDTLIEEGKKTGIFRFYINYLTELSDDKINNNSTNEYIEVKYPLTPGYYSFLWQYIKTVKSPQSEKLNLKIESLEISGLETSSLDCKKCLTGFSNIGSDHCEKCEEGKYYDNQKMECLDCPEGTLSFDGNGIESCVPYPNCNDDNYYMIIDNKCNDKINKQEVSFDLIKDNCIEVNKKNNIFINCEKCSMGQFLKKINDTFSQCDYCPNDKYSLDGNKCIPCEGNLNKIAYYNAERQKKFNKVIEIINDKGELSIKYKIINKTLKSNIYLIIDNIPYIKEIKNEEKIILEKGNHDIKINSNNIYIEKIIITNTKEGGGYKCDECPTNLKIKDSEGHITCTECLPGYELNIQKGQCIKCEENTIKINFGNEEKCKKCPEFTKANEDRTECVIYNVLTQKSIMQKYIISNYENVQSSLCKMTQNLCYSSLYGPIRDKDSNLYFISYKSPKIFFSSDFSYTIKDKKNKNVPSYIYSLTKSNNNTNEKLLNNLGNKIESIKVVKENEIRGVIIKYENGDDCEDINGKKIESYLFLKCSKDSLNNDNILNYRAPTLIKKDKCEYYFEWDGKAGCPICLSNEVNTMATPCREGSRYQYYSENLNCIISNTTNLYGNNIEFSHDSLILNEYDEKIGNIYNITFERNKGKDNLVNVFYVEGRKIDENCTIYEDYDSNIQYILIAIPIIYVIVLLLYIYICCKYRRIKGDYHRLVEDPVDLPQSQNNNQVIEMEQKEKNEEKLDEKEVKIQGP